MRYNNLVELNITQEDIDAGVRYDCEACPVALSAQRVFLNVKVQADHHGVTLSDGRHYTYVGDDGYKFVGAFDRKEPVQPFTLLLVAED